ncbi:MAG: hypothetical protein PF569_02435 [Candidatus Woesearchaeota archaeon]|jgi:hypothetical protein|nr:hypothetical protein [Candidatus Woesearchaeota archaeon]
MIRQFSVTFEFDDEKKTASKLAVFQDGVEQKKTTTSKKSKEVVIEDEAFVTLESNKLVLNNKAALDLGAEYQDRVAVKYEKVKNEPVPFPIIGKDLNFDEEGSGNKVTKSNTVSYRGNANAILAKYGEEFKLEPYITTAFPEGIFKLVSNQENSEIDTYKSIVDSVEKEEDNINLLSDDEGENIEEMTFKL